MRIVDVAAAHPLTRMRVSKEIVGFRNEESLLESSDSVQKGEAEAEKSMLTTESVENFKRRKYKTLIRDYGASFNTAAVETTGGLGKEFRDLLDDIAHEAIINQSGWEKEEIISGIRNASAVAIQIGNARLIHENRSRILRRQIYRARGDSESDGTRNQNSKRQKRNHKPSSTTAFSTSTSATHSNRPVTEFLLPSSFSVASTW